jgi:TatD DNase family protein
MSLRWFDSHAHLDVPRLQPWGAIQQQQSRAAGVAGVLVPAVDLAGCASALQICREQAGWAWPALGLHPLFADKHQDADIPALRALLMQHPVKAVGEIGLDGFVPGLDMSRQIWLFEQQLRLACELDLPVILHVRRAVDLVLRSLRRYPLRGGIAHAFNGSEQQAEQLAKRGFKLGFGGAMTYTRALHLRRLAQSLPLEWLVLETDAPDMRPAWLANAVNSPLELPRIGAVLAELRGEDVARVARITTTNAYEVLGVAELTV